MKFIPAVVAAAMLVAAPSLTPRAEAHGMVYADLAERVSPAVVNIFTEQAAPEASVAGGMPDLPEGHPLNEFFKRFGGMPGGRGYRDAEPSRSLGSGFIFSPEGYVITNHHVIANADSIKVALSDEREFDATVIGSDKATDVALIKIESGFALPFVTFGDSAGLRVGEEVVAVGNAFGLGGTVTRGIVSAKGRDIRVGGPYVDYIQTDASINRGNSGGPLFNMRGEVVGMNTAIFSPTGGSVGIGFAVPSSIVSRIIDDLRDDGTVSRGWIGVGIQPVTDAIASALDLPEAKGTIVSTVSAEGPSVGVLREGDVILSFNGRPLEKGRDLPRFVARTQPGASVPVEIMRDRARQTLYLTVGTREREASLAPAAIVTTPMMASAAPNLGVTLAPAQGGVEVISIEPGSAARSAGIERGDVIMQVADRIVTSPEEVQSALVDNTGDAVLLRIERDGRSLYVGVSLS